MIPFVSSSVCLTVIRDIFHSSSRFFTSRTTISELETPVVSGPKSIRMAREWDNVKAFVLDIYGVVYVGEGEEGGVAVPGSIEAIKLLRQSRTPFRFLSNQSTSTREQLCKRMKNAGLDIMPHEITALAPLTVKIVKERNLRPFLLVKDEILEEFKDVNTVNPNCVVIGDAEKNFSYENVNRAFSVLVNSPKPILLSMGCGRYYSKTDGLHIDVGAYCKGLEYACGIQAECLGKPDPTYFRSAVEEMKQIPEECVMVGDDIKTDIDGAKRAGLRSVLVKTGKYRAGDETRTSIKPDHVANNLLEVVKDILKL